MEISSLGILKKAIYYLPRSDMKLILVSRSFPPKIGGSATILGNLFKHFPRKSYVVFKEEDIGPKDPSSDLDCKKYSFNSRNYHNYLRRFLRSGLPYFISLIITAKIIRIVKKEKIDCILSVFPDPAFFIASFFAHKFTRKSLFIYMHDTWEDGFANRRHLHGFMAGIFEKKIFCSASKAFVVSKPLRDLYAKKYGIQSIVLPHCIDLPKNVLNQTSMSSKEPKLVNIVFTGDIYHTNLDSLKNMVNTINSMSSKYKLIICTPVSLPTLQGWGIDESENIDIRFVSREEAILLQRQATILFLPLAFNNNIASKTELATAFPTKTIEYMISGVPILIHAPSNYYISKYAMEEEWGFTVNDLNPDSIKEAIIALADDRKLREKLVENALEVAADHDGVLISRRLIEYLKLHD